MNSPVILGVSCGAGKYIDKFFSREYLMAAIDNTRENPFSTDILIVGLRDTNVEYKDYFDVNKIPKEYLNLPIYMHIDTSKTKDRTGISAVAQSLKNPEIIYHLFTVYIQAPKNDQICFAKHENFIYYLYDVLNWDIKNVSSDGYNSDQLKQNFILHGIGADYVTADGPKNKTYPTLQRLLYDGKMKLLPIPLLEKELTELDMQGLKQVIDHPINGSKDGSDSLACAVQNLVNHRIETPILSNEYLEADLITAFKPEFSFNQNNRQQVFDNSDKKDFQLEKEDKRQSQTTRDDNIMEYFRF